MGIREGVGPDREDAREREGSQERRPRTSQGVLQWLDLWKGPRAAEVGRGQITTVLVGSAKKPPERALLPEVWSSNQQHHCSLGA